jgi:FkbM family methyltransferase
MNHNPPRVCLVSAHRRVKSPAGVLLKLLTVTPGSAFGRFLRLPFKFVPKPAIIPILGGPLAGLKWVAGSGLHRCWLGCYELPKQKRFAALVGPGMTVYDVGANSGIYTLLAARCVGRNGRVHAFEPLPENLTFLHRHVEMNRLRQVMIHPNAVSGKTGTTRFARGANHFVGHLDNIGDLEVKAICLDEFAAGGEANEPDVMKIDVEGAELQVLQGSRDLLARKRPVIFLATHGKSIHQQCCEMLMSLGYHLEGLFGESAGQADELLCLPFS